jgi:hypothetical protein
MTSLLETFLGNMAQLIKLTLGAIIKEKNEAGF